MSTEPDSQSFDLDRPWKLSDEVALRPESFGALAYHFGSRRLSFLKSPKLLEVVRRLGEHESGREACLAVGVNESELGSYKRALGTLAQTEMITRRD